MKAHVRLICLIMLLLIGIPAGMADEASQDLTVELFAINVGKADAILVTVGEKRFLVDTGTKDSYPQLESALSQMDVSHLDGVFLTHTDKDHGGGMKKLSKSAIAVDAWYASPLFYEKKEEKHQAVKAARERNTSVTWLSAGDVIDLGSDCRFEVLCPLALDKDDENNNSLVMRLITPEGNALLTGDMEMREEAMLLASGADLSAVYLKVAHHGRDDATSAALAAAVSPEVAVISTSSAERPDSPAPSVIDALTSVGAQVYVTQDFDLGIRVRLQDGHAELIN